MSQADRHIASVNFVDGVRRYVFQTQDGRQYVLNAAGKRVYGVLHSAVEECDEPVIAGVPAASSPTFRDLDSD